MTASPHLVLAVHHTGGQPQPGLGLRLLPVERPEVPLGLVHLLRLDRVSQSENQKTFYPGFCKEQLLKQCVFTPLMMDDGIYKHCNQPQKS